MAYIGNSPGNASSRVVTRKTATAGQTSFASDSGYATGYVDVLVNGIDIVEGVDFTATDGINIVLSEACAGGEEIKIIAWIPRGLSDGYLKSEANALLAVKADLVNGLVPSSQLPSYVDDVLEYTNYASFPATGEAGKIYVDKSAVNKAYRWSGSAYILITDLSAYYTAVQLDTLLSTKANQSTTYTKTESDTLLSSKLNPFKRNYSSLSGSASQWFPLFNIGDRNGPILCNLYTYAHRSVSFMVMGGYQLTGAKITVLTFNGSTNGGYACVNGLRVRNTGWVEARLSWSSGPAVDVQFQLFGSSSEITIASELVGNSDSVGVYDSISLDNFSHGSARFPSPIQVGGEVSNGGALGVLGSHVSGHGISKFKSTSGPAVIVTDSADNAVSGLRFHSAGADKGLWLFDPATNEIISESTAGLRALKINMGNQIVNTPYNPAFCFRKNNSQTLSAGSDNIVAFSQNDYNTSGSFSNNRFTAPVAGYYQFQATCMGSTAYDGYVRTSIQKNGGTFFGLTYATVRPNYYESIVTSTTIYLTSGDYVELVIYPTMTGFTLDNTGNFSGHLIG